MPVFIDSSGKLMRNFVVWLTPAVIYYTMFSSFLVALGPNTLWDGTTNLHALLFAAFCVAIQCIVLTMRFSGKIRALEAFVCCFLGLILTIVCIAPRGIKETVVLSIIAFVCIGAYVLLQRYILGPSQWGPEKIRFQAVLIAYLYLPWCGFRVSYYFYSRYDIPEILLLGYASLAGAFLLAYLYCHLLEKENFAPLRR